MATEGSKTGSDKDVQNGSSLVSNEDTIKRYKASMVLSGVGDALGFKNGDWEFCFDGERIHKELENMGGLKKISIKKPAWIVSDDTVLHLSTAEALMEKSTMEDEKLLAEVAARYKSDAVRDMTGRSPGMTTLGSCVQLRPLRPDGYRIPFNKRGGGCGAAMRAMCIGLRYPDVANESCLEKLIKISIETGRMTHHHPTGYLGALASAYFTALALNHVPLKKWGYLLLSILPKALDYIKSSGHFVEENEKAWDYFQTQWENYLKIRGISDGESDPVFPNDYNVKERDAFYKTLAFAKWAGASGHDAPMIAYDALLASGNDWEKLCLHGMLHSGDNDSTGVIAGSCLGAWYGFEGVPKGNYKNVEYHKRLSQAGEKLFSLAVQDGYLS